jgi:hypothetical protein
MFIFPAIPSFPNFKLPGPLFISIDLINEFGIPEIAYELASGPTIGIPSIEIPV